MSCDAKQNCQEKIQKPHSHYAARPRFRPRFTRHKLGQFGVHSAATCAPALHSRGCGPCNGYYHKGLVLGVFILPSTKQPLVLQTRRPCRSRSRIWGLVFSTPVPAVQPPFAHLPPACQPPPEDPREQGRAPSGLAQQRVFTKRPTIYSVSGKVPSDFLPQRFEERRLTQPFPLYRRLIRERARPS